MTGERDPKGATLVAVEDMKNYRRKKKLIEPRLQLKFALIFVSTAGLSVLVQMIVLGHILSDLAASLPNDGVVLLSRVPEALRNATLFTFALLAPLILVIGILSTFRIVGPMYRFREFLGKVIRGENPPPCRIRDNDDLQDFCELLNEVTAPLREGGEESDEDDEARPPLQEAA